MKLTKELFKKMDSYSVPEGNMAELSDELMFLMKENDDWPSNELTNQFEKELQSVNEDLGLHPLADIPKLKTNANEEVYNELTNKYIPDMKKFAEKINTEFVDFKVNNRGEVVIKVLDDNKPRNITFYHPLGGHPFIKVGGEHAYYQCKNPLKKRHSAEQAIELILAKLK